MDAILELNSFLIKFKLNTKNNKNYEQNNLNKFFEEQKIETFNFILKNFVNLDLLIVKLKVTYNTDYLKNFMKIIKNNKKEIIDLPIYIICQKNNYLKGKFALYCGHYTKALEFFYRSREKQDICDASIIRSSIKQISKIIKHFEIEIVKNLSQNEEILKNKNTNKKLNAEIKNEIENLSKITDLVEFNNEDLFNELQFYNYSPKDVIILIDFSQTMINLE